jgi:hypothetical protein
MVWDVEFTPEFERWWDSLSAKEQEAVNAKVRVLEVHGPSLGRPHADVIVTSKHPNMKELRAQTAGKIMRVLFAFDPRRSAILLIGADKAGDPKWYEKFVPIADEIFDRHLAELRKERK